MTTTDSELAKIFLTFSRNKLVNEFWPRLKTCVEPMSVEQVWWRPNEASNSVGNLLLHLNATVPPSLLLMAGTRLPNCSNCLAQQSRRQKKSSADCQQMSFSLPTRFRDTV